MNTIGNAGVVQVTPNSSGSAFRVDFGLIFGVC
jgi:hypothetical protein